MFTIAASQEAYGRLEDIKGLIRKEHSDREALVAKESYEYFYQRESRQQDMYDSITYELELRRERSRLHKKVKGKGTKVKDEHYLMDQDKRRLGSRYENHVINRFYTLLESRFMTDEIGECQDERLGLILEGKYKDNNGQGLLRIVETIHEEVVARDQKQTLDKKCKGPGNETREEQKKLQELLKESLETGKANLAIQEGWTAKKAQEVYEEVKQALVG